MAVRRLVHAMGYRYRLHRKNLPGKPDLVFVVRRKVIFIHGCFWHQHSGCRAGRPPRSNTDYWLPKLRRNQERDRVALAHLADSGWKALVIWECETKDSPALAARIKLFLQV
ncbi:DNA mismatch endonuclease Vsr [Cupriavidus gilardii]|nr:DNA mismatch endonuclease Vsr [Cupriavidus gilardii]